MTTMEPTAAAASESPATNGDARARGTRVDPKAEQGGALHPTDPQPQTARQSPDPMQGTDRYRLVTPFTLRL